MGQESDGVAGVARTAVFPLRGGMWDVNRALWNLPQPEAMSVEQRLTLLEAEMALRSWQARYFDALDSGDIETILSFFHDDCVQIGTRGTYVGKAAIRRDYEHVLANSRVRLHYATNVAVRLLPDGEQAWMTARNFVVLVRQDGSLVGASGTTGERLVKDGDRWLIRERRATSNAAYELAPTRFDLGGGAPGATNAETTFDLIGPDAVI